MTLKARMIGKDKKTIDKYIAKNLELYVRKAIEFGASDARIISARDVVVDERVRLKCSVPKCHLFGSSPSCPPYSPALDEVRRAISRYKYAILLKNDVVPKEDFVDSKQWLKGHEKHQGKTNRIVSELEALAFNDGYYLAMGFAAGGCKTALCSGMTCQYLDSGRCKYPLRSRPSMEGVGIDVFDLVSRVGWDIYPVAHEDVDIDSVKCAISVGIVFIY